MPIVGQGLPSDCLPDVHLPESRGERSYNQFKVDMWSAHRVSQQLFKAVRLKHEEGTNYKFVFT